MRRLTLLLALCLPARSYANPHPLPFTYPYETLPQGEAEVEQFADVQLVQTDNPHTASGSGLEHAAAVVFTTEFEFGLTDRLELGLYGVVQNSPWQDDGSGKGQTALEFGGVKQRLRYRLFDPGELPVDISVYGELAESPEEIELEAKINLQRRVGPLTFMVNLWAEREFYFSGETEWVAHPTGGVTWQVLPQLHIGLEYWMHYEFGGPASSDPEDAFNRAPHSFIGPAIQFQTKRVWVAAAPYLRLDRLSRADAAGDEFGKVWFRMAVGVDL